MRCPPFWASRHAAFIKMSASHSFTDCRTIHDPQPDARGAAAPEGRLLSLIAAGKNPKIDLLLAKRPPRADRKPNRANFWEAQPPSICLFAIVRSL
jgi:hypothetical protein